MRMITGAAAVVAALVLTGCGGDGVAVSGGLRAAATSASPSPPIAAATGSPAPAATSARASAQPGKTTAKPATKTPSPATTGPKVTSATISLAQTSQHGYCPADGVTAELSWVVHLDSQARASVALDVQSTDGLLIGGTNIQWIAENGAVTGTRRHIVTWDKEHPKRTVEYWIQTLTPNRVQSNHVKFTIDCGPVG